MHVKRTGGAQIIVGDWDVTITQDEADGVDTLSKRINPSVDGDTVSDTGSLGGGLTEIHIGGDVYYDGQVTDPASEPGYHTFSQNVRNLIGYIDNLLVEYDLNVRVLPDEG